MFTPTVKNKARNNLKCHIYLSSICGQAVKVHIFNITCHIFPRHLQTSSLKLYSFLRARHILPSPTAERSKPSIQHDLGRVSHSLHRRAILVFWLWPCHQLRCVLPDEPVSLWMNMTENTAEDHANISCATYKCTASIPKGQSTESWYQQCWQTGVALKTGVNTYLYFQNFYVSLYPTLLLSFTYTARLFKRKLCIRISIDVLDQRILFHPRDSE